MTPSGGNRRLPYVGALDGVRAFAVLAVLLYHIDAPWSCVHLRGGFFGVDVFFVLSGYLITSLLLAEYHGLRHISLPTFWLRRARRLLPAVFFLLAAVLIYALAFLPEEVASLRRDALAALAYITNWYFIFQDQSYFESWGRPSLFQHLWSLAIEEQFYLIWPLAFVIGMRVLRAPGMLIATLCAALASTIAMAALYEASADPSRIYYGTDTRSTGLLIGSALAIAMPLAAQTYTRASPLRDLAGVAGLATLAFFIFRVSDDSQLTYQGGFLIVALATAGVLVAVVGDRSRVAGALALPPLVAIGRRSYSIYLWHWPVFMLTRPGLDVALDGWPLFLLRLVVVFALAEFSYRFIEMPFRTGTAQRLWDRWRGALTNPRYRRAGVGLAAAGAAGFVAVAAALWQADTPASLSSSSSIAAPLSGAPISADGQAIHDTPGRSDSPVPVGLGSQAVTPLRTVSLYCAKQKGDTAAVCGTPTPTTVVRATPTPTGPPPKPRLITAIGDSVMLGAAQQLAVGLETADIHAAVGMQASEGAGILAELKAAGTLGEVVVVHLGNNGQFTSADLAGIMDELEEVPLVVFVNLRVPRDWQDNNNRMLAEAMDGYPNARLVDWHAESDEQPQYFWNDGLHLRLEGALVYTARVLETIRTDWPRAQALASR